VLNSVNISSSLVSEKIANRRCHLAKVVTLIDAHAETCRLLGSDPKAAAASLFVRALGPSRDEQEEVLQELASLKATSNTSRKSWRCSKATRKIPE